MKLAYHERQRDGSYERKELEILSDVMEIHIEPQPEQEALVVHINSDAILVYKANGQKLAQYEFTDILSDAEGDT